MENFRDGGKATAGKKRGPMLSELGLEQYGRIYDMITKSVFIKIFW